MLDTELELPATARRTTAAHCRVAVIWIDWYAYHVARFMGLASQPGLGGAIAGIELVGGIGVHAGLRFREDLPSDLPIHTLLPQTNWSDAGQLRLSVKLWRMLSTLDPEVVLVPGYYTLPAVAAALWARLHARKSVLMTESTEQDHHRHAMRERMKAALIRTLFNWAVVGGERHARYLRKLGFPDSRVVRFYDVVDNEALARACGRLRRGASAGCGLPPQYFLYVGRLAPEKNIHGLLEAYFGYRNAGGKWGLVLVGDGPERSALEQRCAHSPHATDVRFAGHKSSGELPGYYASASCFVLPSTREPWGLVVNEAMACGLPVIVSNRCGCADDLVIPGQNGLVFDPADANALQQSLATIANFDDRQLRRMGACSEQHIASYSPKHFGEQIALILDS